MKIRQTQYRKVSVILILAVTILLSACGRNEILPDYFQKAFLQAGFTVVTTEPGQDPMLLTAMEAVNPSGAEVHYFWYLNDETAELKYSVFLEELLQEEEAETVSFHSSSQSANESHERLTASGQTKEVLRVGNAVITVACPAESYREIQKMLKGLKTRTNR